MAPQPGPPLGVHRELDPGAPVQALRVTRERLYLDTGLDVREPAQLLLHDLRLQHSLVCE